MSFFKIAKNIGTDKGHWASSIQNALKIWEKLKKEGEKVNIYNVTVNEKAAQLQYNKLDL